MEEKNSTSSKSRSKIIKGKGFFSRRITRVNDFQWNEEIRSSQSAKRTKSALKDEFFSTEWRKNNEAMSRISSVEYIDQRNRRTHLSSIISIRFRCYWPIEYYYTHQCPLWWKCQCRRSARYRCGGQRFVVNVLSDKNFRFFTLAVHLPQRTRLDSDRSGGANPNKMPKRNESFDIVSDEFDSDSKENENVSLRCTFETKRRKVRIL